MAKLKALLFGGEDRNIPDDVRDVLDFHHVEQSSKSMHPNACPDAKCIILIAKFSRKQMSVAARDVAKKRKIPFVSARTGNYIIDELVKQKLIQKPEPVKEVVEVEDKPGRVSTEAAPTVADVAIAASPSPPASKDLQPTGLNPDELWDKYGQKAIETLRSALKPGEKIAEDDLLSLFQVEGGVGLPAIDAIELLPELSMRGVILNVKGKTWKMAQATQMDDGADLDQPDDVEEVASVLQEPEPPVEHVRTKNLEGKGTLYWAALLGRLPSRTYENKYSLWGMARTYKEFSRADGLPIAASYGTRVIPAAIELGTVIKEGDKYRVRHCDDGPLTVREGVDQNHPWAGEKKAALAKKEITKTPQSSKDIISMVNKYFGGSIPTIDRYTLPTKVLKKMIPGKYWDTLTCQCIARAVNIGHHDNALTELHKFSTMERDRMAYEVLGKMPIEVLIPFLKDEPKDQELSCMDCMDKFIVSVQEWKYLQDKFKDEAALPKRCQKCRDKRKDF